MPDDISRKHKAFSNRYIISMNATKAYMETYKDASYETAMVNGSKLLRNTKVKAYLDEQFQQLSMTADEAIKRIDDIARGDMADLMDVTSMGWALDMKKAQERGKTKLIKKVKQTTITKIGRKQDDDDEERTYLEVELYPADAALDKILRVHGKYNDKLEISGEVEAVIKKVGADTDKL